MLSRRRVIAGLLAVAAAGSQPAAHASVARAIELGELVRASEMVVRAVPLDYQSAWEVVGGRRRIVTTWRVRLEERLDGGSADAETLVRTLGGTVGKVGQIVHGEAMLVRDQPCILFLGSERRAARPVVGMAQGHYPIVRGAGGASVLRASPRLAELSGEGAVRELVGRSADHARARVLQERERAR